MFVSLFVLVVAVLATINLVMCRRRSRLAAGTRSLRRMRATLGEEAAWRAHSMVSLGFAVLCWLVAAIVVVWQVALWMQRHSAPQA